MLIYQPCFIYRIRLKSLLKLKYIQQKISWLIPLMNYFNYGMSKVRINLARNTAHSVIKSALFYLRKKAEIKLNNKDELIPRLGP